MLNAGAGAAAPGRGVGRLESQLRREKELHGQCRQDLIRKSRLVKELRMRIPGQGLGAWLTGPQRPPELVFPQTTRSRVLREIKDDMSLRVRPRCIEVRRLKPQTTRRGQDSVRLLEIDSQTPPFLVPTKLLREGKLKLKKIETEGRPSRSGPASIRIHYELPRGKREELESLCRMF